MKKQKSKHKNKYLPAVEAEIDLHEFTREEAALAVEDFLKKAKEKKYKRIRIITGKGLHSESGRGILREYVKKILEHNSLKYSEAKIFEGGSGAIEVEV